MMLNFEINYCNRQNLCVDCNNKDCSLAGKLISDCPKYRCDREGDLFEDCESCDFLKVYSNDMREFYDEES